MFNLLAGKDHGDLSFVRFSNSPITKGGVGMRRHTQKGNILFLILLAVVLFAALSYAVTSSMRGGGQDGMSEEAARAAAAQLINAAALVENTVMRMGLSMPYQNIQYWTGTNTGCASNACRVFHPDGGGLSPIVLDNRYKLDPAFAGGNTVEIRPIRINGIGTDKPEIAIAFFGLKPEICRAINKTLNLSAPDDGIFKNLGPYFSAGGPHSLGAGYAAYDPADILFETDKLRHQHVTLAALNGRSSFCGCESNCGTTVGWRYQYWHVIQVQ